MISKTFCMARMILLASFALSSAAWAATCSNASLSGTYGLLHGGTDKAGQPTTAVSQLTFDPTTGTYTGEDTSSHDGVITTMPVTGTYSVASNCIVAAIALGEKIPFVVTSKGFFNVNQTTGVTAEGFGVKQGSPTCTNAGVKGSYGFETTGVFLAGAPAIGPVAFIGELKLTVNTSGDGVISGRIAGSEDGTILTFADEPVTGSYKVDRDCRGTATLTPKGHSEMHFGFVVVDCGQEMLAVETDTDTVVSGTLVKDIKDN
jgi:hypothetical protein